MNGGLPTKAWKPPPTAISGNASAQWSLGYMYAMGSVDGTDKVIAKDSAEAVKWFRKAAEQGESHAQLCLGACYAVGDGVIKDYVEAYRWYNLASAQGEQDAKARNDVIVSAARIVVDWLG